MIAGCPAIDFGPLTLAMMKVTLYLEQCVRMSFRDWVWQAD